MREAMSCHLPELFHAPVPRAGRRAQADSRSIPSDSISSMAMATAAATAAASFGSGPSAPPNGF